MSSPSATSSSSADSQEDLLPELWLELPPQQQYTYPGSFSNPFPAAMFSPENHGGFHIDHTFGPFETPSLVREESLEYAKSLLPNSLLPATGEPRDCVLEPSLSEGINSTDLFYLEPHTPAPHRLHEMNSRPVKARQDSCSSSSSSGSSKGPGRGLNTQLYKTEHCASFMKMGVCPYGNKCQFAHGESELKRVERPSNWRSKPCANWTRYGSCRYGKRCCFKHGE